MRLCILLMACGAYDSMYWLYSPMYQKDGLWLDDVAKELWPT